MAAVRILLGTPGRTDALVLKDLREWAGIEAHKKLDSGDWVCFLKASGSRAWGRTSSELTPHTAPVLLELRASLVYLTNTIESKVCGSVAS